MNTIVRLDTRGRLVIPNEIRESLNLKTGDEVLVNLDLQTDTITITPTYGNARDIIRMDIKFGDTPGCLAKIAEKIAALQIDLITTTSRSSQRGKRAHWDIIADISKTKLTISQIKQQLMQSGFIEEISITKITRDTS